MHFKHYIFNILSCDSCSVLKLYRKFEKSCTSIYNCCDRWHVKLIIKKLIVSVQNFWYDPRISPTHTNLYPHYSSTPQSSKDSVISSLTRRAHTICSPCHLEPEIQLIKQILLSNSYPLRRINLIMARTLKNFKKKNPPKLKTSPSANILLPYPAGYHKDIKSALRRYEYDISTTFSSSTTLMSLLNTNKAPTPKSNTMNTINKIACKDCDDYYIGQTCRPIIKRIKVHELEACHRLNNFTDSIGNIKSAPAKHSHDMQHNIDWRVEQHNYTYHSGRQKSTQPPRTRRNLHLQSSHQPTT